MIQNNTSAANVFTDLNGLQSIRSLSKESQDEAMMQVAKQFESMFISMMMKSMRDASDVFSEDSLFNSPESDFYQNMYDDQMALSLASGQGTGLADVIHRQLMAQYGDDGAKVANVDQNKLFDRRYTGLSQAMERVAAELERQPSRPAADKRKDEPASSSAAASGLGHKGQGFASPAEFVAALYPLAEKIADELGVDPKAVVAQAALETGWGQSMIRDAQGRPSHNLFGIKANAGWDGDKVRVTTHEYRNGVRLRESADFRSYASLEDGLRDYVSFLSESSRYQQALQSDVSGQDYGYRLQQAGYATDPEYGAKIERIYQGDLLNQALKKPATSPEPMTE